MGSYHTHELQLLYFLFKAGIRIGTIANISSIGRVPDACMPTSRIILIMQRQTNYIAIGCGGGGVGGEV